MIARKLGLIISVALIAGGCASTPNDSAFNCGIFVLSDELTNGLVTIEEPLISELLQQLPAHDRSSSFCWYQLPEGTLQAQLADRGYEFSRETNNWLLKRELVFEWTVQKQ